MDAVRQSTFEEDEDNASPTRNARLRNTSIQSAGNADSRPDKNSLQKIRRGSKSEDDCAGTITARRKRMRKSRGNSAAGVRAAELAVNHVPR